MPNTTIVIEVDETEFNNAYTIIKLIKETKSVSAPELIAYSSFLNKLLNDIKFKLDNLKTEL
jgi:hypothetical protein